MTQLPFTSVDMCMQPIQPDLPLSNCLSKIVNLILTPGQTPLFLHASYLAVQNP